jgi:chromosome segregation ATPase
VLGVLACGDDPRDALTQDIAKLKQDRVESSTVAGAEKEADRAEAALKEETLHQESLRQELAQREAKRDGVRREIETETGQSSSLSAAAAQARTREESALGEAAKLDEKVAGIQRRAIVIRDQAAALAREIRPEDAPWATERRIQTLRQLLERVAREFPDDVVLTSLAERAGAHGSDPNEDASAFAALAERLRDRLTRVYELPAAAVSAKKPEPSASDSASHAE